MVEKTEVKDMKNNSNDYDESRQSPINLQLEKNQPSLIGKAQMLPVCKPHIQSSGRYIRKNFLIMKLVLTPSPGRHLVLY